MQAEIVNPKHIRLIPKVIPVKFLLAMGFMVSRDCSHVRYVKVFVEFDNTRKGACAVHSRKISVTRLVIFSTLLGFLKRDYYGINIHTDHNCIALYPLLVIVAMFEVQYIKHEKQ